MKKSEFISGMIVGALIFGGTASVASGISAVLSSQPIYVDGVSAPMTAYNIDGNNYVKLRDIGDAVDFSVEYDASTNSIKIDSTKPYTEEVVETVSIPAYQIKQTYREFTANNGNVVAVADWWMPEFSGSSTQVQKMNNFFTSRLNSSDIMKSFETDLAGYNSDPNAFPGNFINEGISSTYEIKWSGTYSHAPYVSFTASDFVYYVGAIHPLSATYGVTFDVRTGDELKITDVLKISSSSMTETLYQEYLNYYSAKSADIAQLARENPDSVKEQLGEDAVFWLAEDGVHISFHQYTFYYAVGQTELVIPYSRTDLIAEPFAF